MWVRVGATVRVGVRVRVRVGVGVRVRVRELTGEDEAGGLKRQQRGGALLQGRGARKPALVRVIRVRVRDGVGVGRGRGLRVS